MSIKNLEFITTPLAFYLDNCLVIIYEVTKSKSIKGETWYHVCVELRYKKRKSPRFSLDVRNVRELKKKLLVEISKFKLSIMLGRYT